LTARGIVEVAEDEVSVRLAAESRRKLGAQALHLPLKVLGYLEFSEIYGIDLGRLPPDRPLDRYELGPATAEDIDYICRVLIRDEPPIGRRASPAGQRPTLDCRRCARRGGPTWQACAPTGR